MRTRWKRCAPEAARRRTPASSRGVALAEAKALDLARRRLRQLGDELDVARIFVRCELVLDERLQSFGQCGVAGNVDLQHDVSLGPGETVRVLAADHRRLEH